MRSGNYAFRDRRARKRDFRRLWIIRINAGARAARPLVLAADARPHARPSVERRPQDPRRPRGHRARRVRRRRREARRRRSPRLGSGATGAWSSSRARATRACAARAACAAAARARGARAVRGRGRGPRRARRSSPASARSSCSRRPTPSSRTSSRTARCAVQADVLAGTSDARARRTRVRGASYRRADLPAPPAAARLVVELARRPRPRQRRHGRCARRAALGADVVVLGRGCADPTAPKRRAGVDGSAVPRAARRQPRPRDCAGSRSTRTRTWRSPTSTCAVPSASCSAASAPGCRPTRGADAVCRIPQTDAVDSLNVAMAATVALYEVARQRAGTATVRASAG